MEDNVMIKIKTYQDIDGDGEVTLKDLKSYKKYIIGTLDDSEISFVNGDADMDGEIGVKDIKLAKKIIINAN